MVLLLLERREADEKRQDREEFQFTPLPRSHTIVGRDRCPVSAICKIDDTSRLS
jgi:hypothetical protein